MSGHSSHKIALCMVFMIAAIGVEAKNIANQTSSDCANPVIDKAIAEEDKGVNIGIEFVQKALRYRMKEDDVKHFEQRPHKGNSIENGEAMDATIPFCLNYENNGIAPLFISVRTESVQLREWEFVNAPHLCPSPYLELLARVGQHSTPDSIVVQNRIALVIVVTWTLFVIYLIVWSVYSVAKVPRKSSQEKLPARELPLGNEDKAWERGFFYWLSLAWLDPLVGRYGKMSHAIVNNIEIHEKLKDVYSYRPYVFFRRFWGEEVLRVGLKEASILRALYHTVGVKSVVSLIVFNIIDLFMSNVGMVIALDVLLSYLERTQLARQNDPTIPTNFLPPTLMIITLVFGVPMAYRTASIIAGLLDGYYTCFCAAGLATRVFQSALDLPVGVDPNDPESELPNIVQICNIDVLEAWSYLIKICISACVAPFILAILLVILISNIRLAGVLGFTYVVPCMVMIVTVQIWNMTVWQQYQRHQDSRLAGLREAMINIRTIKGIAWEKLSFMKVTKHRVAELEKTQMNITLTGVASALNHTLPWGTTLLAMVFMLLMQGEIAAHHIIVIQRIMMSMLSCMELVNAGVRKLFTLPNNFRRIRAFLNAPTRPQNVRPVPNTPNAPCVRASGSFTFLPGRAPTLRDLDVKIMPGELVAVIGGVASGKSAFLQMMLGDLYTVENAYIEGPKPGGVEVSYCAQAPWILEGTLCENVILQQELDLDRYYKALYAAGLTSDLQIFDGGDQVQIGSFGVRLSGGQRSRIALARAAYMKDASLGLFDDPFASVDVPTANHIFRELFLGVMKDRTRIVATQPNVSRLRKFDRVLLIENGIIVESGPPNEVIQSTKFRNLLASTNSTGSTFSTDTSDDQPEDIKAKDSEDGEAKVATACRKKAGDALTLREAEGQDYATWKTFMWWVHAAGKGNLIYFIAIIVFASFMRVREQRVLAVWINAKLIMPVNDWDFILLTIAYVGTTCLVIVLSMSAAGRLSVKAAQKLHSTVVYSLLRAPIDKFFDKQPIGRIVNRLSYDMRVADHAIAFIVAQLLLFFVGFAVTQWQILSIVPWYFALVSIPFYAVFVFLMFMYKNTAVPIVFESKFLLSRVQDMALAGMSFNVSVRANGMQDHYQYLFNGYSSVFIRCQYLVYHLCQVWVQSRVFLTFAVLTCTYAIGGVFTMMPMGTLSLIISLSFSQMADFENASLMFSEFINLLNAVQRITAYFDIPHEAACERPDDPKPQSRVKIECADILSLTIKQAQDCEIGISKFDMEHQSDAEFVVCMNEASSKDSPVLVPAANGRVLRVVRGRSLLDLAPKSKALSDLDGYDIVAVNNISHDAAQMAEELCNPSASIWLELLKSKYAKGIHVQVQDLIAGYGNASNVLHSISFDIPPFTKVGIAGKTGCGKSTLMLCILRILEPRSGRVLLGDLDTSKLGLYALRSIIGLVPQDPTIFEGTVRYNIDPFNEFSDGKIWESLRCVQLVPFIRAFADGIYSQIAAEGGNLSFGQKQLMSLARMVIRQPPLLLLDECTSALDPSTQDAVQTTLLQGFRLSTIIAIAHRIETILDFDQIIVLDKGIVIEGGDIGNVLKIDNGLFANMVKASKA